MKGNLVQAYDADLNLIDVPRKETKLINGEYFIPGISCHQMEDGSWHRITNGKIGYLIDTKSWGFLNANHVPVVYDLENKKLKIGFIDISNSNEDISVLHLNPFSLVTYTGNTVRINPNVNKHLNNYTTLLLQDYITKNNTIAILSDIAEKFSLFVKMKHELYTSYRTRKVPTYFIKFTEGLKINNIKIVQPPGPTNHFKYSLADIPNEIQNAIKDKYNKKVFKNDFEEIYKCFRGKSFGVEIETSNGNVPEEEVYNHGFTPLRDGSLRGGIEYTSIPFTTSKGLDSMKSFYKLLQNHTETSSDCSFHVHVGGFKRTKLNAITLYQLCRRLQEELFDIVPIYKKELAYFSSKRELKDHCQSLKNLNINLKSIKDENNTDSINREFNKLFTFVTEGQEENNKYNFENKMFPRKGQAKWNLHSRYFWVNFIPFLFMDQETVEFRIFESSLDFEVSFAYLITCVSILNYVEDYGEVIREGRDKILISDVLYNSFPVDIVNNVLKLFNEKIENNYKDFLKKDIYGEINRQVEKYRGLSTKESDKLYSQYQNNRYVHMDYGLNITSNIIYDFICKKNPKKDKPSLDAAFDDLRVTFKLKGTAPRVVNDDIPL